VSQHYDVALVGGGIMSATLGTLLQRLEPTWTIGIFERLSDVALESSNPWNNAGTGHSAFCELNYTPEKADGSIDVSKAIDIAEQFQLTRQFWSFLVNEGVLPEPSDFINPVPHMTFVWGEENVAFLRKRYELLKDQPLFAGMEYSEDAATIRKWAPLLIVGRRKGQPIAATRIARGTDVDFGAQTHDLIDALVANGAELRTEQHVKSVKRRKGGGWTLNVRHEVGGTAERVTANFVFIGAGGMAIRLLQSSGIPEIKGYGGFPISGLFLRTDDPEIVAKHNAKVYGKASVGAPPMSVPHLDTRVVGGEKSVMFGPYAGFSTNFLKHGSLLDLFASLRWDNIPVMLGVAFREFGLLKYLLGEVFATRAKQNRALLDFAPGVDPSKFYKIVAGQRVQMMKRGADGKPMLAMGTEVVASADGSIAGLLGASPGASTSLPIMLDLIRKCFPERLPDWEPTLKRMVPSYGTKLNADPVRAETTYETTGKALELV